MFQIQLINSSTGFESLVVQLFNLLSIIYFYLEYFRIADSKVVAIKTCN